MTVGHHVDQPAALRLQTGWDLLAGKLRNLHQELVGARQAHREIYLAGGMLPGGLDVLARLDQLPGLQHQRVDGVGRVLDFVQARTAGIHAVLAVGGGIEHLARIAEEAVVDFHFLHHAPNDAVVA